MRKLLLLALMMTGHIVLAQKKVLLVPELPVVNGEIVYDKAFDAADRSATQLYNNAGHWFMERYKSAEQIEIKDKASARVVGNGIEVLTFKGPLNREVSCKLKMKIEIVSKNGGYRVRVSHIIYGYQEDPTQERTYFSAEDLHKYVSTGKKVKNAEGINPIPFNKKQSAKALESLNPVIENVMASISQTMAGR